MSRFSPYLLWTILSLPAAGFLWQFATATDPRIAHLLLHPTGEFSARFLIVAMLASPLMLLFRQARFPRWLRQNRRAFGVASFGYAALHTLFYVIDRGTFDRVIDQIPRLDIWTGWLAFLIFVPLAITSADWALKAMGPAWKALQRWTYPAAVLTLIHWAALHDWASPWAALVHFGPLAALNLYRLWYWYGPRRAGRLAA